MKLRLLTILGLAVLLLLAASPTAKADPINNFSFSTNLIGASGSVSGSFSYNTQTHSFSNVSLTFNSPIFGNIQLTPSGQNGWIFYFNGWVGSTKVIYAITMNPLNFSQFWVTGVIYDTKGDYAGYSYSQVPEGSDGLTYLIASAMVMLGAVVVATGKQRSALRT
jgi:hypothetical protein